MQVRLGPAQCTSEHGWLQQFQRPNRSAAESAYVAGKSLPSSVAPLLHTLTQHLPTPAMPAIALAASAQARPAASAVGHSGSMVRVSAVFAVLMRVCWPSPLT